MTRALSIAIAVLLFGVAPATAQDPTVVDPDHYAVEYENDQIRVLRITYGPNEKSVMHEHPDAFFVGLTASEIRMHLPDGGSRDVAWAAGETLWTPADEHLPENLTDEEMVGILVELKDSTEEE